jgi:hypothetical protein
MNKIYRLLFLLLFTFFLKTVNINAQCPVIDTLVFGFNDPSGAGYYTGFLCNTFDSVGTTGPYGYYNGDSHSINLVAGSQVIFSVDSCNGNGVSLTIADSLKNIIPGAFASSACPNSLTFTAPYTGSYYVIANLDGICNVVGSSLIGQIYVQIDPTTTIPDCPVANIINDTICGAIPLTVNGSFVTGNTTYAYPTDPLDGYITSIGFLCSPPNNTLWYSYTASVDIDTMKITVTSDAIGGFHSWLAVFTANDSIDICNGGLSYIGCEEGPNAGGGIDTATITLFGLMAGHVYYFMIDGYNGATGSFSIGLKSSSLSLSVLQLNDKSFMFYPNPSHDELHIHSALEGKFMISIFDATGQEVMIKKTENLWDEIISINGLKSGIYVLRIYNDHFSFSRNFMVKN